MAHPLTLVDVGARGGIQPNWRRAERHLRVVGFEPDPVEHARLAAGADSNRAVYINAAAADSAREITLNVARLGGTSSLFEPNLDFLRRFPDAGRYEVVRREKIAADRIDVLLPQNGIRDADFIKIDTQGAEHLVLEGAREMLERSVFGVEVEVLFAPLYAGQSRFGAVDDLMDSHGYHLFDIRPSYWKRATGARCGGPKGQLAFGDALYLKAEGAFATQLPSITNRAERAAKLLRALSICALYGYLDYALELLTEHRGLLDPAEEAIVESQVRSNVSLASRVPHFRGKGWLSHLLYRMHRAFAPTVAGWASGGRHLGNVD